MNLLAWSLVTFFVSCILLAACIVFFLLWWRNLQRHYVEVHASVPTKDDKFGIEVEKPPTYYGEEVQPSSNPLGGRPVAREKDQSAPPPMKDIPSPDLAATRWAEVTPPSTRLDRVVDRKGKQAIEDDDEPIPSVEEEVLETHYPTATFNSGVRTSTSGSARGAVRYPTPPPQVEDLPINPFPRPNNNNTTTPINNMIRRAPTTVTTNTTTLPHPHTSHKDFVTEASPPSAQSSSTQRWQPIPDEEIQAFDNPPPPHMFDTNYVMSQTAANNRHDSFPLIRPGGEGGPTADYDSTAAATTYHPQSIAASPFVSAQQYPHGASSSSSGNSAMYSNRKLSHNQPNDSTFYSTTGNHSNSFHTRHQEDDLTLTSSENMTSITLASSYGSTSIPPYHSTSSYSFRDKRQPYEHSGGFAASSSSNYHQPANIRSGSMGLVESAAIGGGGGVPGHYDYNADLYNMSTASGSASFPVNSNDMYNMGYVGGDSAASVGAHRTRVTINNPLEDPYFPY